MDNRFNGLIKVFGWDGNGLFMDNYNPEMVWRSYSSVWLGKYKHIEHTVISHPAVS